jgi:hypothetical protein
MIKIKDKEVKRKDETADIVVDDNYYALVLAIKELTEQLRRLNG